MRDIVFALIGAVSGWRALGRARTDIAQYRSRGETFGTGSFTSHVISLPIVIVLSSALYVGMARTFAHDLSALVFGVLVGAGMWLVLIDLDTHLLPRRIVYRSIAVSAPLLFIAAIVDELGSVGSMMLGGLIMWIALQVCEVLSRGGVGKGDVAFAGFLGLFVGWISLTAVLVALLSAFVAGGVVALVLLITRHATRSTRFAFGPFLFFGALVAVLR